MTRWAPKRRQPRTSARTYGWWLWPLTALFVFRVVAQPLALVMDAPYLPPFDAWHSGALPYGALAASQIVIIGVLCYLAWQVSSAGVVPRRRVGILVLAAGSLYFMAMLGRLALGMTVLSHQSWFARPVPTTFHLVLAGFLLVYGHFHFRYGATD